METRRSFFAKALAGVAAIFSLSSLSLSSEEEKPCEHNDVDALQGGRHYDMLIFDDVYDEARAGDMLLCEETGEVIRLNGDGTCVRGLYNTLASDTDIHLKIDSEKWQYIGRFF